MTEAALRHAGVGFEWVLTGRIVDPVTALQGYAGVLIAPGSPYKDFGGGRSTRSGMRASRAFRSWVPEGAFSTRSWSSRATFLDSRTQPMPN